MKTVEFIDEIKKLGYDIMETEISLVVYKYNYDNYPLSDKNIYAVISKRHMLSLNTDVSYYCELPNEEKYELFRVLHNYAHTPISERSELLYNLVSNLSYLDDVKTNGNLFLGKRLYASESEQLYAVGYELPSNKYQLKFTKDEIHQIPLEILDNFKWVLVENNTNRNKIRNTIQLEKDKEVE